MVAIVVLLFAGAVLALVVGALILLSEERGRRELKGARYRFTQRRMR